MAALDDDFRMLIDSVRDAGDLAHTFFRSKPKSWRKADGSFVSEGDLASNDLLYERLMRARPDYGWLSEETEDSPARLSCERVWMVDPIDGTQAFLNDETDWCVSAALVANGQPVLAAIYNPARGEYFSARQGAGATLNGATLQVQVCDTLDGARMLASKGVLAAKNWKQPLSVNLLWANSIAYRICMVAAGRADITCAFNQKWEWDLAAGVLVAKEAGYTVTGENGQPLTFNNAKPRVQGVIVAPPALHRLLLARKK
ncbi:MAG: 3'(2'),5'-bisphosphate nucleotidase CysQ [Chitinophagales bacterium]|nr:3'(2'),5'-bisphosphate nucleotidase CysQ [Hyphomicrobiales bacterium]